MKPVARFEKVSFTHFMNDIDKIVGDRTQLKYGAINSLNYEELKELWESIELPKRATKGSAGYDFFSPFSFCLFNGKSILIPTGIRCKLEKGYKLVCYPRSSQGFVHYVKLANTVGIIDEDYYNSANEGHIMLKLCKDDYEEFSYGRYLVNKGDKIMQGIFEKVYYAEEDEVLAEREGGIGSTDGQHKLCN